MRRQAWILGLVMAAGFVFSALSGPSARASEASDFYKGKTLTWMVSTGPGGGHDFYARLIVKHMAKFMPDTTIIVKNVPGAGHIIGANTVYLSKPDGLTIGSFSTGLVYGQIVQMQGIQFDLAKMSWIGKAASDSRVMLISKKSWIKTLDDMRDPKRQVLFATSGIGSGSNIEAHMVTRAFGLNSKILTGYVGNEGMMSMLRAETHATMDGSETSMALVNKGDGFILMQFGKELPDIPDGRDFAKTEDARKIVSLLEAQSVLARICAGPPGIPADRLAYLREVYRKTLESPELLADAEKAKRTIKPMYGEEVTVAIQRAMNQPDDVVELLKSLVTKID
jgi:tripartite-type tricarboxylate transporter receptor subunit TctC